MGMILMGNISNFWLLVPIFNLNGARILHLCMKLCNATSCLVHSMKDARRVVFTSLPGFQGMRRWVYGGWTMLNRKPTPFFLLTRYDIRLASSELCVDSIHRGKRGVNGFQQPEGWRVSHLHEIQVRNKYCIIFIESNPDQDETSNPAVRSPADTFSFSCNIATIGSNSIWGQYQPDKNHWFKVLLGSMSSATASTYMKVDF